MQELIDRFAATLAENGGSMTYVDFLATVSFQDRQQLPRALQQAKSQGVFVTKLAWDNVDKTTVHTVELVGD